MVAIEIIHHENYILICILSQQTIWQNPIYNPVNYFGYGIID